MPLPIFVTSDARIPLYLQIKHQVRYLIASRQLQEGSALPSVRGLARQLDVTANTVAQAYKELIADGVIVSRQGRGTFVSPFIGSEPEGAYRRLRLLTEVLAFARERAASLGFSGDELRHHLTAILTHPATIHLVVVAPSHTTAEKYRQILSRDLGAAVSVTATTLEAVEAGSADVLDAFQLAYFTLTFPQLARRLEQALVAHNLLAEIIPITAELTPESLEGLAALDGDQRVFLVTEERNIATALNILLQHSPLAYSQITSLPPDDRLEEVITTGGDLVIYTLGVRNALDALEIPESRRYELAYDLSDDALQSIRKRLGLLHALH